MKKVYMFYLLIIGINVAPFIPMWYKGLLGLFFIIIVSARFGRRSGLCTVALLVTLKAFNFIVLYHMNQMNHMDSIINMIMSSLVGLLFVYYLGGFTDELKAKNSELHNEIQKRKNIEQELKDHIALSKSLMDTMPTPICFKDLECRYLGCNSAFVRDFGISETDLFGKNVNDLYDMDIAHEHNERDLDLLKSNGRQVYETLTTFADGRVRNVLYHKTLFSDEFGNPAGILGILIDITDKKESEKLKKSIEEEELIIEEMKKNDKMKTEFFSNISHELRTPINVILGAVQLLEIYSQDSQYMTCQSKVIRNVASMKLNCLRLLRLVNNLIDITQIEVQAFKMNLKNWDVVNLVEEITLSVSEYVNNKGINLQFDTDIEEKIIACDDEHMERILLNLLSNAIKFTQNKGNIYVHIFDQENGVCIQVRDTGMGIPADSQKEIFKRFCQVRPLFTKPQEGSGIGLSIVKSLVELHDGTITVESEIGKGTTFHIFLPDRLVNEEEPRREKMFEKRVEVEKIQLEFSDIYYAIDYQMAI